MDCITDLDDNQSRLLEALHLSVPAEAACSRKKRRDKKLSLNPIYRQVPRALELCCQHLESHGTLSLDEKEHVFVPQKQSVSLQGDLCQHSKDTGSRTTASVEALSPNLYFNLGLQTVGIFRVGSSRKRVRQV